MMVFKNKIKVVAFVGIGLSIVSLLVHLLIANYSAGDLVQYRPTYAFFPFGQKLKHRVLWGSVRSLEAFQPYSRPKSTSYIASTGENGFIFAKVYGGFDRIRSAICDLVVVARLLNATLVIPEIQDSLRSKGISSKFRSFSYVYNEDKFIGELSNDVVVVKSLPDDLKVLRKKNKLPVISSRYSSTVGFYIKEVLPKLKQSKAVGIVISNGRCLESILPPSMADYQRLRCRVAFHALQFRSEILTLGNQIVSRLRSFGRPFIAYHSGLARDALAYNGCAELFQDIHAELIQYRRKQMIKGGIAQGNLNIDSYSQKQNGSCPIMPEEVGLVLRANGYQSDTFIYLAGSEIFGGQRILVPLRALYPNLMDRSSLCSKKELLDVLGPEYHIPSNLPKAPPEKSEKALIDEWKKAGPRPRPLPPPPARPFYSHEKEGWYGWVADVEEEPEPSPIELRMKAHRLIWDAVDYHVSVEADAFFPGFHNDGSGWPDFASLVMGHRLYQKASRLTYRIDRKAIAGLFEVIRDNLYHPKRNWTVEMRQHLNKSLGIDGFIEATKTLKPALFLSHPFPECSCRISSFEEIQNSVEDRDGKLLRVGVVVCPDWLNQQLALVSMKSPGVKFESAEENVLLESEIGVDGQAERDDGNGNDQSRSSEQDEEMDLDD